MRFDRSAPLAESSTTGRRRSQSARDRELLSRYSPCSASASLPGPLELLEKPSCLLRLCPRREPLRPLDLVELASLRIPGDELRNEEASAEIEVGRAPGHGFLLVVRDVIRSTRSARASRRAWSNWTSVCSAAACRCRLSLARHFPEQAPFWRSVKG